MAREKRQNNHFIDEVLCPKKWVLGQFILGKLLTITETLIAPH